MLQRYKSFGRFLLTVCLLSLPWPEIDFTILVFFAFVPVLLQMNSMLKAKKKTRRFAWWVFAVQLVWSLINTYWISHATWLGTVASSLVYAGIFTIPFILSYKLHYAKGNIGHRFSLLILVLSWLSIDYLQLYWDLYWPWFHLGNAFANRPDWVQWYEYTGVFGGTLWVWIANIAVYRLWLQWDKDWTIGQKSFQVFRKILVYLLFPIALSYAVKNNYDIEGEHYSVAVYQPNYDSYTEKYKISQFKQWQTFEEAIDSTRDKGVDLYVCPETFLHRLIDEEKLEENRLFQGIQRALPNDGTAILTGINSYREMKGEELENPGPTAFRYREKLVEMYNAAIVIDSVSYSRIYHKSKLVAGVEMVPFENVLVPLLGNMSLDFGGQVGSLGRSKYPQIIPHNNARIAPVICFESVFGDYVSQFVQNGANLICIITNDSWWGDTAGYKQHMAFARLRAIENRRYVVRSANTGISAIIDPYGKVRKRSHWDERTLLRDQVQLIETQTLFSIYKHAIGRLSIFVLILILLHLWVQSKRNL
jgi:apolipoprotein N-acyltransferase